MNICLTPYIDLKEHFQYVENEDQPEILKLLRNYIHSNFILYTKILIVLFPPSLSSNTFLFYILSTEKRLFSII